MQVARMAAVAAPGLLLLGGAFRFRRDPAPFWPRAEAQRDFSFPMPMSDVHCQLAGTGMPPHVSDVQGVEVGVVASDPAEVGWILEEGEAETMRFAAALRPVSERRTAVTLTLRGVQAGRFGDVAKRSDDRPGIEALYLAAMGEQVSATLEHRPYQASATYPAMAVAVLANMQGLANGMAEAGRAAHRRDEATVAKAYADEAAGRLPLPAPRAAP